MTTSENLDEQMVSIIIPTFNRAYIIQKTLPSYLNSKCVGEVIIVADGVTDCTHDVINEFKDRPKNCDLRLLIHDQKMGAAAARLTGLNNAKYQYIMFGEDDVYIEDDYPTKLLKRLLNKNLGFVSGRIIYLLKNESLHDAKKRFNFGLNNKPLLDKKFFRINQEKYLPKDCETVFSHALYMSEKSTLQTLGFDQFYRKGTGYREETDAQVRGFFVNKKHMIAHDAFCFHMNFEDVPSGGQRLPKIQHWYWNIILNNYFFKINISEINKHSLMDFKSTFLINLIFIVNQTNLFFIRPYYISIRSKIFAVIKRYILRRT